MSMVIPCWIVNRYFDRAIKNPFYIDPPCFVPRRL